MSWINGDSGKMDANFGGVHDIELDAPAQLAYSPEKLLVIYFATRLANAITTLFRPRIGNFLKKGVKDE